MKLVHVVVIMAMALSLAATACEDRDKKSRERAPAALDHVMPLVERDVKQVREGLPKGAELMGRLIDDDPGNDPEGLRHVIEKARGGVLDLSIAKSTFFVFVSPQGTVLRSEADPDLAAGQSLFREVPDGKNIFTKDGLVEVFGTMHGLRGVEKGGDLQWIVGKQVKSKSGKVAGAFVTGWSFRRYLEYLENDLRHFVTDKQEDKKRPPPLVYLFLVRGGAAYGAPITPDVDSEAVAKLDIASKAASGQHEQMIEIDGQHFALVARKLPAIDEQTFVVLLFAVT